MADPRGTTISVCNGSGCAGMTGLGAEMQARQARQEQQTVLPAAPGALSRTPVDGHPRACNSSSTADYTSVETSITNG